MNFIRLFSAAIAVFIGGNVTGCAGESLVYFGTYTGAQSKGIYVSRFDAATGGLSAPELAAQTQNPCFLALSPDGHFLYASGEVTDANGRIHGVVNAFARDAGTGRLTLLNRQDCDGNSSPCYISVDASGRCLLAANYGSGSLAVLPVHRDGSLGEAVTTIQHHGSGVNLSRQAGPHPHFILPSPDNRFALNCDLGLDKVFVYRLDPAAAKLTPNDPPFALLAPGSGPRHLVFSRDGKMVYVISEMAGTVTAFRYAATNAAMTEVQVVSTLPADFSGSNTAAEVALRPDGKFLYASNRGDDSIVVFAVNRRTGRLTFVERQPALGRTPRHFAIDPAGRWLLAEHQGSDSVAVFAIDARTGRLRPAGQSIAIGAPVCAVFAAGK